MTPSMRAIKVAEEIVPVGEFKKQATRWLRHTAETGKPVVITHNGKPARVLLSPTEYDRLTERQRFVESVALGLADADAGRTMDTKKLLRRIEERRNVEESDDLDDEDRARLHDAIRAGQAEMDAGKSIPSAEIIARLRANRR
jgi:prevent-host-death family protein